MHALVVLLERGIVAFPVGASRRTIEDQDQNECNAICYCQDNGSNGCVLHYGQFLCEEATSSLTDLPFLIVGAFRQPSVEKQNGDLGRACADEEGQLSKPAYESY